MLSDCIVEYHLNNSQTNHFTSQLSNVSADNHNNLYTGVIRVHQALLKTKHCPRTYSRSIMHTKKPHVILTFGYDH